MNIEDVPNLDMNFLETLLRRDGLVTINIGSVPITFNLSFLHERKYVARYITNIPYPQHDIDQHLFDFFVREGDVVLDAGANIGVTAAIALQAGAARVFCVEPEENLASRLKSISDSRVKVIQCALGEHSGVAELMLSSHNQGHTIAVQMQNVFPGLFTLDRQTVAVKTVAEVTGGIRCDIWKLDVEGVEPEVIRGAMSIIEKDGPRIIFAELFEPFAPPVLQLLEPWYEVKRAALTSKDSRLCLLDPSVGPLDAAYWHTSPTYVFQRREQRQSR